MEATDPATGVGALAAMAAGTISFLSPCVLPLVPAYLAAVTGLDPGELEDAGWRRVLVPSLLFVAAFSAIFILLGLTATGLGEALRDNRQLLNKVAGALIVAMGVLFVAGMFVARLNREWHPQALAGRARAGGPLVAGAAFAVAWTPCVGPTLAAILSAAAISESAAHGALLLAFYSVGLAIPFLATALAFSRATSAFAVVKRRYGAIIVGEVFTFDLHSCSRLGRTAAPWSAWSAVRRSPGLARRARTALSDRFARESAQVEALPGRGRCSGCSSRR